MEHSKKVITQRMASVSTIIGAMSEDVPAPNVYIDNEGEVSLFWHIDVDRPESGQSPRDAAEAVFAYYGTSGFPVRWAKVDCGIEGVVGDPPSYSVAIIGDLDSEWGRNLVAMAGAAA